MSKDVQSIIATTVSPFFRNCRHELKNWIIAFEHTRICWTWTTNTNIAWCISMLLSSTWGPWSKEKLRHDYSPDRIHCACGSVFYPNNIGKIDARHDKPLHFFGWYTTYIFREIHVELAASWDICRLQQLRLASDSLAHHSDCHTELGLQDVAMM